MTGGLRKLHRDLHCSQNNIRMIKKGKMRSLSMWHVWETGNTHTKFLWVNLREKVRFECLGVCGRMILK